MHRLFVTYKGQPLVVGTEDDLITIPEPGIEVNEILGSEEVTEKIAEDVAVGDILYKYDKGFDYVSIAPMAYDVMHNGGDFFIHEGYLHYGTANRQRPTSYVYRYQGGKWTLIVGHGIDSLGEHPTNGVPIDSKSFTVLDNTIYTCHSTYAYGAGLGFQFLELFGERWRPLQYKGPTLMEKEGTSYRKSLSTICKAYDGEVHAIASYSTSADGYRNIYAFKYNPNQDGDGIVSSTIGPEPRSSWDGTTVLNDLDAIVHNNELYFVHAIRDIESATNTSLARLYKWSGNTSSWDYCADVSGGQTYEAIKLYSHASGLVFMAGMNGSQSINVHIYDETTSSFSDFGTQPYTVGTSGAGFGFNAADMFEVSGNTYIVGVKRGNYQTDPNMDMSSCSVTLKYNSSTSSWDEIPARVLVKQYLITPQSPTASRGFRFFDVINYNGEIHGVGGGDSGIFNFYKFDPITETWRYNHYWEHPAFESYGATQCGGYGSFSGQSYFHFSFQGNETTFKYITSGEASGSFEPMRLLDILPAGNNWGAEFYETDGTIYLAIFSQDFNLYELNASANQFQRVGITGDASFIAQAYARAKKAHLNGKTYLLSPLVSNGIQLLEVSGSQWNDVSTSSNLSSLSLPTNRTFHPFMESYDEKLIITYDTAYTYGADNEKSYSFDGSSWSEIPFSGTILDGVSRGYGAGLPMYTVDGDLYCIRSGVPVGLVYKYNTSASVWEEFAHQTPRVAISNSTYKVDITMHNGRPAMITSDAMGYTTGGSVMIQTADHIWKHIQFDAQTDSINLDKHIISHDGVLSVFYGNGNNNHTVKRAVLSEFFDQQVWQKNREYKVLDEKLLGVGIALESGSKGDTIRIQKVKR